MKRPDFTELPINTGVQVDAIWISQCYPSIGHIRSVIPATVAGFSGASIWKVTAERGDFALRSTPEQQVEPRRLAGLHRLLAHVRAAGITQVAVPLLDWQAESFFHVRGFVWQLEPWRSGHADFHANPSPARIAAAMQLIARWHRAAVSFVATPEEVYWFFVTDAPSPAIRERRNKIGNCTSAQRGRLRSELQRLVGNDPFRSLGLRILDLFERVAPSILRELDSVRDLCMPLQPCLRDVWHDHLLFDGDEITGLIDPHACRSDTVGTDLSRLLRSLIGSDRKAWDAGIQRYEQLRPLSLAERGLIEVLDRSSVLLSGMTWLSWLCLEKRSFPQPDRVLDRLRGWLPPLEQLAQTL